MGQLVDFRGMLYGRCSPTDIDLAMDFNKECFVFAELKYKGNPLTTGQRIHLMGLVDAIEAGGREAFAILAWHDADDNGDIHAGHSIPQSVYFDGKWQEPLGRNLEHEIDIIHTDFMNKKRAANED